MRKYKLKTDREIRGTLYAKAGDIVYDCASHDYGCANDDTRYFNIEHISVTNNQDGSYPFFTIAKRDLEVLNEKP